MLLSVILCLTVKSCLSQMLLSGVNAPGIDQLWPYEVPQYQTTYSHAHKCCHMSQNGYNKGYNKPIFVHEVPTQLISTGTSSVSQIIQHGYQKEQTMEWTNKPAIHWIANETTQYGYEVQTPRKLKWSQPTKVCKHALDFLFCGDCGAKFNIDEIFATTHADLLIIIIQLPGQKIEQKFKMVSANVVIKLVNWSPAIEKLLPSAHQLISIISVSPDYVVQMSTTNNVANIETIIQQMVKFRLPTQIDLEMVMLKNKVRTVIVIIDETGLGEQVQQALSDQRLVVISTTMANVRLFVPPLPQAKLPVLYVKTRNRWVVVLQPTSNTKDGFVDAVLEYMDEQLIKVQLGGAIVVYIFQKPGSSLGKLIQKTFENDPRVVITYHVYNGADKDFPQVERVPEVYVITAEGMVDLAPPVEVWKYNETIYHWKNRREIEDAIRDYLDRQKKIVTLTTVEEHFIMTDQKWRQQIENCLMGKHLTITTNTSLISEGVAGALYAVNTDGAMEMLQPQQGLEGYVNAIEDYWFSQSPETRIVSFDECFSNNSSVVVILESACSSLGMNVSTHFEKCVYYGLRIENYIPIELPQLPKPAVYGINANYDVDILTPSKVTVENIVDAITDYLAKPYLFDTNGIVIIVVDNPESKLIAALEMEFQDVTVKLISPHNKPFLSLLPLGRIPAVYGMDQGRVVVLGHMVMDVQQIKPAISDFLLGHKTKFDMDDLFPNPKVEFAIIIVQNWGSTLGEEIAKDFEDNPKVVINYVDADNEDIISRLPPANKIPAVYVVDWLDKRVLLKPWKDDKKAFEDAIEKYTDEHRLMNFKEIPEDMIVVVIIEPQPVTGPKVDSHFKHDFRLVIKYGKPGDFIISNYGVYGGNNNGLELITEDIHVDSAIYAIKQFLEKRNLKQITLANLFDGHHEALSAFVIVEEPGSSLGREVEKDFANDTRLVIRYTDSDFNLDFPVSIIQLPEVYGIRRNLTIDHLEPFAKTKREIEDAILDYIVLPASYDVDVLGETELLLLEKPGSTLGEELQHCFFWMTFNFRHCNKTKSMPELYSKSDGIIEKLQPYPNTKGGFVEAILDFESRLGYTYSWYLTYVEEHLSNGKTVFVITSEHCLSPFDRDRLEGITNAYAIWISSAVSFPFQLPNFEVPAVYVIDQHYNVEKLTPKKKNWKGWLKAMKEYLRQKKPDVSLQQLINGGMLIIDYPGSVLTKYIENRPQFHYINTNNKDVLSQLPISYVPVIYDASLKPLVSGVEAVKQYILSVQPNLEPFDWYEFFDGSSALVVVVILQSPQSTLGEEIAIDFIGDRRVNVIFAEADVERIKSSLPGADLSAIYSINRDQEVKVELSKVDEYTDSVKSTIEVRLDILEQTDLFTSSVFSGSDADVVVVIVQGPALGPNIEAEFAQSGTVVKYYEQEHVPLILKKGVYAIDQYLQIERLKLDTQDNKGVKEAIDHYLQRRKDREEYIDQVFAGSTADIVVVIVELDLTIFNNNSNVVITHMDANTASKIFSSSASQVYVMDQKYHMETIRLPNNNPQVIEVAVTDHLKKIKEKDYLISQIFADNDAEIAVVVVEKPDSTLGQQMETIYADHLDVVVKHMDTSDKRVSMMFNSPAPKVYVIYKVYQRIKTLNNNLKDIIKAVEDYLQKRRKRDKEIDHFFRDSDYSEAEIMVTIVEKPGSTLGQQMEDIFADNHDVIIKYFETTYISSSIIYNSHAQKVYSIDREHQIEILTSSNDTHKITDAINDSLQKNKDKIQLIDHLFEDNLADYVVVIVEKPGSTLGQQMVDIFDDVVIMNTTDESVSKIFNSPAQKVYVINRDHHIETLTSSNNFQTVKDAKDDYVQKKQEQFDFIEEMFDSGATTAVVIVQIAVSTLGPQVKKIFADDPDVVIKILNTNDKTVPKIFHSPTQHFHVIDKEHHIITLLSENYSLERIQEIINYHALMDGFKDDLINKMIEDKRSVVVIVEKPGSTLGQQMVETFADSDVIIKYMNTDEDSTALFAIFHSLAQKVYVIDEKHHIKTLTGHLDKAKHAIDCYVKNNKERNRLIEGMFDSGADTVTLIVIVAIPTSTLGQVIQKIFADNPDVIIKVMETTDTTVSKIFSSAAPKVYVIDKEHHIKTLTTSIDSPQKVKDALDDFLQNKEEKDVIIDKLFNGSDADIIVVIVIKPGSTLGQQIKKIFANNPDVIIKIMYTSDTTVSKIFKSPAQGVHVIDREHHIKTLTTSIDSPQKVKDAIDDTLQTKEDKDLLIEELFMNGDDADYVVVIVKKPGLGQHMEETFADNHDVIIKYVDTNDTTMSKIFNSHAPKVLVIDKEHHIKTLPFIENPNQLKDVISDCVLKKKEKDRLIEEMFMNNGAAISIVIVENPGSSLGQSVKKYFKDNPDVVIKLLTTTDSVTSTIFNNVNHQAVYVIDRDHHHIKKLKPTHNNKLSIIKVIKPYLTELTKKQKDFNKLLGNIPANSVVLISQPGSTLCQQIAVDIKVQCIEDKTHLSKFPAVYGIDSKHHIQKLKPPCHSKHGIEKVIKVYLNKLQTSDHSDMLLSNLLFTDTSADKVVVILEPEGSNLGAEVSNHFHDITVNYVSSSHAVATLLPKVVVPAVFVVLKNMDMIILMPVTNDSRGFQDAIQDYLDNHKHDCVCDSDGNLLINTQLII